MEKESNMKSVFEMDMVLVREYPLVSFNGKLVVYDPLEHTLEKGEIANYFDTETLDVKEGAITDVRYSNPFKFPIYIIDGKGNMYHRVWPKVDSFGNVLRDQSVVAREILSKTSPKEARKLINSLEKGLVNKANLSAQESQQPVSDHPLEEGTVGRTQKISNQITRKPITFKPLPQKP